MPVNRFSFWHYLVIAVFTAALGYTEYLGLTRVGNWPPLLAGITTFACLVMSLTLWQSLTANPTRFEAPLENYTWPQVFLWMLVIILSSTYTLALTMYGLLAIGIEPTGSVLMAAILGGFIGSYLFKRTFVPQNWGPYATRGTTR